MAKKKRLNKRVVALLIALGVVAVAAGGWLYVRNLPRDAVASARIGDGARQRGVELLEKAGSEGEGDYAQVLEAFREAEDAYKEAIQADKENPEYPFKLAVLRRDWQRVPSPPLTQQDQRVLYGGTLDALSAALQRDANYLPAQEMICEIRWRQAVGLELARRGDPRRSRDTTWGDLVPVLDKLISLYEAQRPEARQTAKLAQAYFRRAQAHENLIKVNVAHVEQGLADLRKAVELTPNRAEYWTTVRDEQTGFPMTGLLSYLQEYKPDEESLRAAYAEALEKNPDSALLHSQYANYLMLSWKNTSDRAEQGMATAEQLDRARQDLQLARKHYQAAAQAEPDNPRAKLLEATWYLRQIETDTPEAERAPLLESAEELLRQALKIDSDFHGAYADLMQVYALKNDRGQLANAARETLRTLPPLPPSELDTEPARERRRYVAARAVQICRTLLLAARSRMANRDALIDDARKALGRLEQADPEHALLELLRGQLAFTTGRGEEAVEHLEAARQAGPIDAVGVNMLIQLYLKSHPGKAEKLLEQILRADRENKNVSARLLKARLAMRSRRYDEADETVARAIQIAQRHNDSESLAEARGLRRVLDVLTGRTMRLPSELDAEAVDASDVRAALSGRVDELWRQGEREQAAALLADLQSRFPKDQRLLGTLVQQYRALGEEAKAKQLLEATAATYADDQALQTFLEQIRTEDPQERFDLLMKIAEERSDPVERALTKAGLCSAHGKPDEALQYLAEAEQVDPDHPAVVSARFDVALRTDPVDVEAAEKCVRRAADADLDGVGGRWYAARLAVVRGQWDEAIEELRGALELHPLRERERVMLAECYLRTRQLDEAREAFRAVAEADPANLTAVIGMVRVLGELNEAEEREQWLERAHRLAPNNPRVSAWQQEVEEAKAADTALGPYIARRRARYDANPDDVQNALRLAVLYERARQPDEAQKLYRAFYDRVSDKLYGASILGAFYVRQKRYAEVDALMQELLAQAQQAPRKSRIYVTWANLLANYNAEQALNAYGQAVGADPENATAYAARARLHAGRKDFRRAADDLRQVLTLHPEEVGIRRQLIAYQIELRELDAAAKQVEELLAANPDDVVALRLKAAVAAESGKVDEAEQWLARSLEIRPDDLDARYDRARLRLALGKMDAAQEDLDAARQTAIRSAPQAVRFGNLCMRVRRFDQAAQMYREALKLSSDFEPAMQGLIAAELANEAWGRAQQVIERGRAAYPESPFYPLARARMHRARKETQLEVAALTEAHRLAPESASVVREYVTGLLRAGLHSDALRVSQRYVGQPGYEIWLPTLRAQALAKLGQPDQADELFVAAFKEAAPNQLMAWAMSLEQAYGQPEASTKFASWISNRAKEPIAHIALGHSFRRAEDLKSSLAAFVKAVELPAKPQVKATAHSRLGGAYQELAGREGDPQRKNAILKQAREQYEKALAIDEDRVEALNNLAYLLVDSVDLPKDALAYSQRAAELRPTDGNILDTHGWVLAKLDRLADAEGILAKAVLSSPGVAPIHYHLGWVYEKTNRLESALRQYRLAREHAEATDPLLRVLTDAIRRVESAIESRRNP